MKKIPKLLQLMRDNAPQSAVSLQTVRNETDGGLTIYLYDVIDEWWGISAEEVAKAIHGVDANATITLRINSPGGDAFAGQAIANVIRQHPGKTIAYVDGYAASAATTVTNAADEVIMGNGSFYMIHNAMTLAFGNKHELNDVIALLAKVDDSIIAEYVGRTGKTADQIREWMDAETWFTADEAIENGFADRKADEQKTASNVAMRVFDLSAFEKVPDQLLNKAEPVTEPDWSAMHANNVRRLRLYDRSLSE